MKNLIALVMLFVIGIVFTSTASVIKDVKEVKKEVVFDTTLSTPIVFDVVAEVDVFILKPDVIRNDKTIKIIFAESDKNVKPDNPFIIKGINKKGKLGNKHGHFKEIKVRPKFNRTTNK
jgi:hypothetical protein